MRKMKLSEFRLIVRSVLQEFVSNDQAPNEPNFNKDASADPSKAHMDAGLDEEEVALTPNVQQAPDFHEGHCDMCGDRSTHIHAPQEGEVDGLCPRCHGEYGFPSGGEF